MLQPTGIRPFDERSFYVKLTVNLTVDQIRILHLFYLRDYQNAASFGQGKNINAYIMEQWPRMDESYRFALVNELMRYGLIAASEKIQKVKGDGHHLSALGERYINTIFTPVDIKDTGPAELE